MSEMNEAIQAVDYPTNVTISTGPQVEYRGGLVSLQPKIDRKRYVELTQLAHETCLWLESKGLKKGEQCVFSRIAQDLWFSE